MAATAHRLVVGRAVEVAADRSKVAAAGMAAVEAVGMEVVGMHVAAAVAAAWAEAEAVGRGQGHLQG